LRKGFRWPLRDDIVMAYGADRFCSCACTADRIYRLLKDAKEDIVIDTKLKGAVMNTMTVICQRLDDEFDVDKFGQLVGILEKFTRKIGRGFLGPCEPDERGYYLVNVKRQLYLARHVLDMMRNRRLGPEIKEYYGLMYEIRVNPVVYLEDVREKNAILYHPTKPSLQSWTWNVCKQPQSAPEVFCGVAVES